MLRMNGIVEMADSDTGEDEMIDSLFYKCDTHGEGKVYVCTVIQFLKNCLGNGNNEPDLIELSDILECNGADGKVTFQAYRSAVKKWISEIRNRRESTAFLEPDGPLHPLQGYNLSNNAGDLSLNIETCGDGSLFKGDNDIGELINKVEDLKYMNHKLNEDNVQLNSQLEAQDEQITYLTTELVNKNKEEEQWKKKLKSLQDLASLAQNVMEENDELKKKLLSAEELNKELDGKVVNLELERLDLENQVRDTEVKWQISCSDLDLALRETQQLKSVCNEQKNNEELESLKEKLNVLMSQNEKLQDEKEDVQVQLAQMNGKLLSYQSKAEKHVISDGSVEDVINQGSKKSPKLWFSTPLHKNSICMELKDRLNEDKSLPSPFCEKFELSHDICTNKPSTVLSPYMSAWELEVSGDSQNDFSVELLRENTDLSPLLYDKLDSMRDPSSTRKTALLPAYMSNWDMSDYLRRDQSTDLLRSRQSLSPDYLQTEAVKKLQHMKDLGEGALQTEYLKLYRTNLELAEKCHRSELKEGELLESLKEANQTCDSERQRFIQLQESLETSIIARKLDLKDLWRLVHNPDEDDSSETEESISASTELLKKKIQAEIKELRNRLNKERKLLKPVKSRLLWYTHRKRPISPLVEALDIADNTKSQKFFKKVGDSDVYSNTEVPDKSAVSCKVDIGKCNRSVPLFRRNGSNVIHSVDIDEDSDRVLDIDESNCEGLESVFDTTAETDKMPGRKDIPARFQSESSLYSELWTLGRLQSADINSVGSSISKGEKSKGTRTLDSKIGAEVDYSCNNKVSVDSDKSSDSECNSANLDHVDNALLEKHSDLSAGGVRNKSQCRRESYRKAVDDQTGSLEEIHIQRSRSHSFKKAIELGQVSPTGSIDSNSNPAVSDITPEYEGLSSISLTSAPRYSSTPFLTSAAKSVHFEFEPHGSELSGDSSHDEEKKDFYIEKPGDKVKDVEDLSTSFLKEIPTAENRQSNGTFQSKHGQVSADIEMQSEDGSVNVNSSSSKLDYSHVSGSSQPDTHSESTPDTSPPSEYNCSAEFWSLSPSSGSPEHGEISRDSGHSSSIASLEKTGFHLISDTDQSTSPDSSDDSKSSPVSLSRSSDPVLIQSTPSLSNASTSLPIAQYSSTSPSSESSEYYSSRVLSTSNSTLNGCKHLIQYHKSCVVTDNNNKVGRKSRCPLRNRLLYGPESPGFSKSYQEERSLSPSERILQRSANRLAEKFLNTQNEIVDAKFNPSLDVNFRKNYSDSEKVVKYVVSESVIPTDKLVVKLSRNKLHCDPSNVVNDVAFESVTEGKLDVDNGKNKLNFDADIMNKAVDKTGVTKDKLVHLPLRKCEEKTEETSMTSMSRSPTRKGLTLTLKDTTERNDIMKPTLIEPPSPTISFYQAAAKGMKTPDTSVDEAHHVMESNSTRKPVLIQGENSVSHDEPNKSTMSSNLSKIRESHLAKRRDHLRPGAMPQLSELSEKEMSENNNEQKPLDDMNKGVELPPSETNGDVIMPSIPNEFLHKLGLTPEGKSSEELSDQEIESKFTSLSLAFKTDSQTLEKRLEIQERARDIAEQNVDKELQGLRSGLETLNQICTDPQVREVLTKIQNHIDILEKSTARVSSRAEVFGAIQQEKRMSKAVDIMVHHVENIRRVHEREHAELEEARKLLQDSRSLAPSSIDLTSGGELLSRRSASVCQNNMFSTKLSAPQGSPTQLTPTAVKAVKLLKASRRRVSEIALPKVLGGSGAATLHPSASMDSFYTEPRSPRFSQSSPIIRTETSPLFRTEASLPFRTQASIDEDEGSNLNTAHLDSSTNPLHPNYDADARSRLQAVIASTAMKSAVANTLRRASLEKQGNVQSVSPTSTPPQVSRDNSSECSNKQATEAQEKEKQKNLEEEAFKKGYEQGLRASLGQDLSSLREQQNQINESLGDIMDSIDNQIEEPKSLKEILVDRFHETLPEFTISSWRIRMTFGCFFIVMAILSVIMALSPVSMGSAVGLHHYGKPPH